MWLAALALVALALVPTLSRLWAATAPGSAWAEVCSAAGLGPTLSPAAGVTFSVAVGSPSDAAPANLPGGLHALDHCGLCLLAGAALVPPGPLVLAWVPDRGQAPSAPSTLAPAPAPSWPSAQPRAPPVSA